MAHKSLLQLVSLDFEASVVTSSPSGLRALLRKSSPLRRLRVDHTSGAVTDDSIRQFVDGLLSEFATSESFPHQVALAAFAVLFEDRHSPLAEDYLIDLSRVRTARLRMAASVARICLRNRSLLPKVAAKTFEQLDNGLRGHHCASEESNIVNPTSYVDEDKRVPLVFIDKRDYRYCSDSELQLIEVDARAKS